MNADMAVNTTAGAFLAGLLTSVHCIGMCGPVACLLGGNRPSGAVHVACGAYHGARVFAYGLLGMVAGLLGQVPIQLLGGSGLMMLPWLLVLALLVIGVGWDRKLPRPKFVMAWLFRFRLCLNRRSPLVAGALLGLLTPLLPCGPLYLMLGLAAVTGSAGAGAEFTVAFALGTIPLLLLAQLPLAHWRQRLAPHTLTKVRCGLALLSAVIIAWRLQGTLPFGEVSSVTCPLCP